MGHRLPIRFAVAAALIAAGAATWLAPRAASSWPAPARPTDYEVELRGFEADIDRLGRPERLGGAASTSGDATRPAALAFAWYQRASLTNQPADYASARAAIDAGLTRPGAPSELSLLRARVLSQAHELGSARRWLARPELAAKWDPLESTCRHASLSIL